ncbi:hypothetical protein [Colwellia sp. Arc7-D]|uniref:hypothetical protein n=1 Tax=Colwellia sp. Arc7-D TaxID=2161872 RepID=UPI000D331EC8|nr:hypothetical protein [Colwellia sp. Arc7-D]AWB57051.1 hypothetical protein DBO93_05435 [Colwellia sp. Arc7-D]
MNMFRKVTASLIVLYLALGLTIFTSIEVLSIGMASARVLGDDMQVLHDSSNIQNPISITLINGDTLVARSLASKSGMNLLSAKNKQPVGFTTSLRNGYRYVVPLSAQQYVDSGLIDVELFNMSKLYQMTINNSTLNTFSVLVKYHKQHKPKAISSDISSVVFEKINSQLVTFNKHVAEHVWNKLVHDSTIKKVWLDEAMKHY